MIPRKIFQTFEHGNFEPQFQYIIDDWKIENPDYEYHFFNANDRQIFMKHYFDGKVYDAYTRIKPGAFKSDLWRYCVLYVHGGFYIDIDSICLGTLDMFVKKDTEFVAATDLNLGDLEYHNVANAFIGSIQGHPILKNCIDHIVEIVEKDSDEKKSKIEEVKEKTRKWYSGLRGKARADFDRIKLSASIPSGGLKGALGLGGGKKIFKTGDAYEFEPFITKIELKEIPKWIKLLLRSGYTQNEIDAGLQDEGVRDKYDIKIDDKGKVDIRKKLAFQESNFKK